MTDKTDDLDEDALRIGDLVLLKDVARGLYLGVEGILNEDLVATEGINLQDSLFCIHLQRQYSASRDLNAFLENFDMDVKNIEDEGAKKFLIALQKGLDNEKKLNDTYMKKKFGDKVTFGEIIQLFHVKSGKYLTIMPGTLAKVERENLHIMLDVNGSTCSWLQIAPRFKIDKEGDRVLSGAEMLLKVAERTNEYVHSADRPPLPGHHREVNCALEPTSWRLKRYQSSRYATDPSILLASQLVTISDPETRSNLTIARTPLTSLDDHVMLDKPQHIQSSSDITSLAGPETGSIASVPSAASLEDHEYFHQYGDMILEPVPAPDVLDSNHLWFIESSSLYDGGPIVWKSDLVRFKHMNTGQYLVHTTRTVTHPETGEEEEELIFTTTAHPSTPGTQFNVNELNSTSKLLSNGKALQIGNAGAWIERGDVFEDSVFTFMVKGTRDKASALSLMIHRCSSGGNSGGSPENELFEGLSAHEPIDVFSGLAARNYLRRYHDMTVIPRSDSVATIWPAAIRTDLEFFQTVMEKTVFFSQGFPISATDIQLGIDKADSGLRTVRQNLLREQNTLEVVLRMINKLIPVTEKQERMRRTDHHNQKKKKPTFSEEEVQMVAMGQLVLNRCFHLLYYSILDNQVNQMYVADHMPVLLVHLNAQPLAGKCVTEMLSKNMELQETKITQREIQIFVDKLRSSKMNAMYLQLLQACCSCEGSGVDGNQCKVANMLFTDKSDVIISMMEHDKRATPTTWQMPSLYIPAAPIAGSPVLADDLLERLPLLSITWTTNSIEFSPLGLFGKLSVNIQELFRKKAFDLHEDSKETRKPKSSKKKTSNDQKEAVANYFVAEMFLGAEMCMDRNYVAINKLKDEFTYRRLVTVLKLDVSSNIKSAAVRLLMCLHVDRDPQAASKIPLLTRTWTDIKKNAEPQLPYVDNAGRYKFGLIQQLISEHVHSMAGVSWDELSWHMLRMLRTLAQFNFYGTNERMTDLIAPLIRALDRRSIVIQVETVQVKSKPRKKKDAASAKRAQEAALLSAQSGDSMNLNDDTKEDDKFETENIDATLEDQETQLQPWYKRLTDGCGRVVGAVLGCHRDAKIAASDDDSTSTANKVDGYVAPLRYSKAPIYELDTMVEAVDILAFAQQVIEDRNVSLLMRYFYAWESGADKRTPSELFEQVVEDSKQLSLGIATDFNSVMLDVLMFVHTPLTQSTLEVLMAHHSMRRTLLDNANNVQLLASPSKERLFTQVRQMLQQLEENAETHELWGELETEAHHQTNQQTKQIISELIDHCRIRRTVLEFDEEFEADTQIQDLYRNLGCFEICMKVMGLYDSVEEDDDGNLSEVALNTKDLCLKCNNLLYWYFLGNPKNQEQGFSELDEILDSLDNGINSHLVIKALFKNNESLMRRVPHSKLSALVEKISKEGQSHHYLALFAAISHVGEKNISENQFEIVKTLTSPGRLAKVACYLCPVDHPDYQEKRELMLAFKDDTRDLTLDDLPPQLAYHLAFLDVLSGCTVGRLNVTTVEAKVQSVFNNQDIISSILDPDTILVAKIKMSRFLFNAVIEVELVIPGLERSYLIWKLLDSYQKVLQGAKEELVNAAKLGWESPQVSRQRIEYIVVCIEIIGGFFGHYYENSTFRGSDSSKGPDKAKFTKSDANRLIVAFFHKIKEVYDLDSPLLSEEVKVYMNATLETLKKHGSKYIHVPVAPRMARSMSIRSVGGSPLRGTTPNTGSRPGTTGGLTTPQSKPGTANAGQGSPSKGGGSPAKKAKEESERRLIDRYNEFLAHLAGDAALQARANHENVSFITLLESLPFIQDKVEADVRYETLIRKLVFHIRENIKIVNGQKRLDARVTKTSTWIMKAFRTMIENKMGMTIFERDDNGGAEQDEAAAPVVNALNSCGGTALCLDLIADGIDKELRLEAVRLGVGLLFKEGGALEVQKFMHNHLQKTQSDLFFKQVSLTIAELEAWHSWNGITEVPEGEEVPEHDDLLILRFLQLMCEGHFLPNQDIMREQPTNQVSYNLLDSMISFLNCLSRLPCRTSSKAADRLLATILEVIQGPCEGNQAHFALETELVEALNRMNRAKVQLDCVEEEEIGLKKTAIDIFQGLLEGQGEKSVVYDRVLSVIHLDIILMMSKIESDKEDEIILQTECVVLLQMLCNYKPSLYDELGISRNIEDIVGSGTAMIEVVWRGDLHRRFFHVPPICSYLAKASKDALVENVDRTNSENKLIDFLARSHDLYREVKHQEYLTEKNMSTVFSRQVQNVATWITFFLAIFINAYFLATYTHDGEKPTITARDNTITFYINLLQALVSAFTLILWLVVRSPVVYKSALENSDNNQWEAIKATAQDPLTVYYVVYLTISVLGVTVDNYYCCLLLLDIIVKNSITRDVLMSMVTPWKQLVMALILELFVIYIFSFYIFYFFRDDNGTDWCYTLLGCFKFTLSYGLQNGGGVGDTFIHSVGQRLILDLAFFCVVIVILLNVIFGIIIDTFSSMRVDKLERVKDTLEICFICGINKQVFDRASDEPDGFKTHIKVDHNMWNYLYFIFMLWEQDKDDDDGLEQYVRRAIDANEITWFPIRKAMRLEQVESPADLLRGDLKQSVKTVQHHLSNKFDEFQSDVNTMFDQLLVSLKNEPPPTAEPNTPADFRNAGLEEDSGSIGGYSQVADSSYVKGIETGKHISVAMVAVQGVALSESELRTVHCRVIYDGGMDDYRNVGVGQGTVYFDEHKLLPLFDNVVSADRRKFQVQVLYGVGVMKFIAVVEMTVLELLHDTEERFTVEKVFSRQGQEDACILRMLVTNEVAKTFGRGVPDKPSSPGEATY